MSLWATLVAVGLTTFLLRASFIVFTDPERFPTAFRRALVYVSPAVLAALVVPGLFAPGGVIDVPTPRLVAGLLAIVVAARTRSVVACIATGMASLWILQWIWPRIG